MGSGAGRLSSATTVVWGLCSSDCLAVEVRVEDAYFSDLIHPTPLFEGASSLCSECSLRSRVQSITGPVACTNA